MKSKLATFLLFICFNLTASGVEFSPEIASKILKRFPKADQDGDGKLSKSETAALQKQIIKRHPKADSNGDGQLSKSEQMQLAQVLTEGSKKSNLPAPTHTNVKYGEHERHILDIWISDAAEKKPTPLALYIHGGGFSSGSKEKLSASELDELLKAGISVASVNYRYKTTDPLPAAHHDCKQALQFIRSKASEWNLDKERVAVWGSSAGAQLCMWLAYSDEMADPASSNPIERESTRVTCVATKGGQTTMDEEFWRKLFERFDAPYDPEHRLATYGVDTLEEANKIALTGSALELISSDDPPIYMSYGMAPSAEAPGLDSPKMKGWLIHHVVFGTALQKKAESLSVESHLQHQGKSPEYRSHVEFMVDKLAQ